MMASTITARRIGDPQHMLREEKERKVKLILYFNAGYCYTYFKISDPAIKNTISQILTPSCDLSFCCTPLTSNITAV